MIISFYSSDSDKCGIADYTRYVVNALKKQGTSVNMIPVQEGKSSTQFIEVGKILNLSQVAHIQHEYAFFSNNRVPILFPFMSTVHFFLLIRQVTVPKIITLHELMAAGITNPVKRFAASLFLKSFAVVLNKCDRIIVHTERFRNILLRYGVDEQRVLFIPHPFPAPALPQKIAIEAVHSFKRALGLEGKTILTIFGFVYPRKGYEIAFSALQRMDNCVLLIAGGPHPLDMSGYYESLVAKIAESGLQDKVRLLNYIPGTEIDTVMLATDFFLAPYLDAPGSGSISRIAVYHRPIIASDIPTIRELKEKGFGVELCKAGDSQDLHDAVQRLLSDKVRREQLIEETERFIELNSYDSFAKTLISLSEQSHHGK
jgi:polysaccharide biosynthesis protein PslF